jgi:hypothetical protein
LQDNCEREPPNQLIISHLKALLSLHKTFESLSL